MFCLRLWYDPRRMKIPRYWAKGIERPLSNGRSAPISCWKWSDISVEDAQDLANARAVELARISEEGTPLDHYAYADRPLREEIVQVVGQDSAVVTRNLYGSLVLNASRVMFIDVDLAAGAGASGGLIGRLFGKSDPEGRAMAQIRQWAARHSELGTRIYRTRAGFRCLVINQMFDPAAAGTLDLLREAGSDPLYIRL